MVLNQGANVMQVVHLFWCMIEGRGECTPRVPQAGVGHARWFAAESEDAIVLVVTPPAWRQGLLQVTHDRAVGLPSPRPFHSGRGGAGLVTVSKDEGNAELGDTVGKMCSTLPIPLPLAFAFDDVTA
jgi:hypothetical protein